MTPRELEDRLINFAVNIIRLSEGIKPNIAGNNLSGQIVRSSSSVALNYGEAQSAESPKQANANRERSHPKSTHNL